MCLARWLAASTVGLCEVNGGGGSGDTVALREEDRDAMIHLTLLGGAAGLEEDLVGNCLVVSGPCFKD